MFWRVFCIYGVALLAAFGLLGAVMPIWSAAAITGLIAILLAFWLSRHMARPLQELTRGAERIAAGEFGRKVYVGGRDEFGLLARTFNNMSQRLAEQFAQLQEDRQQLRTILTGMEEGVIALDAEERILFANERAAAFLGFQIESAVERKLWEIVRQRPIHDVVRRVLAGEAACRGEMELEGLGGRFLLVQGVRLPGASPRGAVLVLHDTTELRRLERVRQEFVANVSHELKTPLSIIKACIETLLDGAIDDTAHREGFLQQVADQAEHLHALILDLLSLAKIESGSASYEFEPVDLAPIIAECLERHRTRALGKQQSLEAAFSLNGAATKLTNGQTSLPSPVPLAWADQEAISQILENLVDNALKYTAEGGKILVRCRGEADQVLLEVEDTGIGIPERDLARIFERFYRVDKARSRELGGTGLGLSIVKHLVQAMHGSVNATSRPGKGTTFEVRFPRAPT
jgi:two-component system phosphate regulon sensor histidine kinase PhoR